MILNYIYNKYPKFFREKVMKDLKPAEVDLRDLFNTNKEYFESLLVEDFIGYIPKNINEPALKIIGEYGEALQKWILWQSWGVNRKALHDTNRLQRYDGMMVYLKVLHTLAEKNKSSVKTTTSHAGNQTVEVPWIDKALGGLEKFREINNEKKDNNASEEQERTNPESDSSKGGDVEDSITHVEIDFL